MKLISDIVVAAIVILILDFAFKIQIQLGFAVVMRKRLPITYSVLPWPKTVLLLSTIALGAYALGSNSPNWDMPLVLFTISLSCLGVYGYFAYAKEMEEL